MEAVTGSSLSTVAIRAVSDSEKKFEKLGASILRQIFPLLEQYRSGLITARPVIAIAGCSGVGKTYFSKQLLSYLIGKGVSVKILSFDDFQDLNPFEGAIKEIHQHFDWKRLHKFLNRILDGELVLEKPAWNQTGPKPFKIKESYNLEDVELLIFEGEFTFCDKRSYDLLKYSNVRIVVDADDVDITRWDWERARYLETTDFDEFTQLKKGFLSKYRKVLNTMKPYADFTVLKDNEHIYQLVK